MKLTQLLANHVDAMGLGVVYAGETEFILARNPDTVLAPDLALVARPRVDQLDDVVDRGGRERSMPAPSASAELTGVSLWM
jgi:hypothetical protein